MVSETTPILSLLVWKISLLRFLKVTKIFRTVTSQGFKKKKKKEDIKIK